MYRSHRKLHEENNKNILKVLSWPIESEYLDRNDMLSINMHKVCVALKSHAKHNHQTNKIN